MKEVPSVTGTRVIQCMTQLSKALWAVKQLHMWKGKGGTSSVRFHFSGTSKDSENTPLYPKSLLPKGQICSFALHRVLSLVSLWAQETSLDAKKSNCQCLFSIPCHPEVWKMNLMLMVLPKQSQTGQGVAGVVWCKIRPNVSQLLCMATPPAPVKRDLKCVSLLP